MSSFATQAILIRRVDFGDYDLIITFFTQSKGKMSVIAKSAKKSAKRFSGILELFSVLDVVCSPGRRKGLPVLSEAAIKHPFAGIRSDIIKTAYASYWAELINEWMEENQRQDQLYRLFEYVLKTLDLGHKPEAALSILFQMRFMAISGLWPNLESCSICQTKIEQIEENSFKFDLVRGGLVCNGCTSVTPNKLRLSKGTIKQLLWIKKRDLAKAIRIKFTSQALQEGLKFSEAFVPYHIGRELRSQIFLNRMRQNND
jgi:DNA repair protein RecO (recombination protein O)